VHPDTDTVTVCTLIQILLQCAPWYRYCYSVHPDIDTVTVCTLIQILLQCAPSYRYCYSVHLDIDTVTVCTLIQILLQCAPSYRYCYSVHLDIDTVTVCTLIQVLLQCAPWYRLGAHCTECHMGSLIPSIWLYYRALSFVYPYGATLNVMKPSAAVLSSGSVAFPLNRPVCAFYQGVS